MLKAESSESGPGWTDQRVAEPRLRTWDGEPEAYLVALACSQSEESQQHWTLQLLADTLVHLRIGESLSRETVRQV